ncbi:RxLR-like protein [Plasmopara halstedii]|uniref:RxLR-like protein n=1 Tax=Plasmopara halstedii TaxID=4781 RepID=A0A0P1A6H7_PLAHL|nr:RxLR-like protein [Plasmopara halstedii]CEG35767.1 RxLR-like protein [Plasmopara halstedii]|eukprot:XP_024572136.1 RxLR-like protein [Plasmopara halstedii]
MRSWVLLVCGMSACVVLASRENRLLGLIESVDPHPVVANNMFASKVVEDSPNVRTKDEEARTFQETIEKYVALIKVILNQEHPEAYFNKANLGEIIKSQRTTSTLIPWVRHVVAYRSVLGHDYYTEEQFYELLKKWTDEEFVMKFCQDIKRNPEFAEFAEEMMTFLWLKSKMSPEQVGDILLSGEKSVPDKDALLNKVLQYSHKYRNLMLTNGEALGNLNSEVYMYRILGLLRTIKKDEELKVWLESVQAEDGLKTFAGNLAGALERDIMNRQDLMSSQSLTDLGIKMVFTKLDLTPTRQSLNPEKFFQWLRFCALSSKEKTDPAELSGLIDTILELLESVYPKNNLASLFDDISNVSDMKTLADQMENALRHTEA